MLRVEDANGQPPSVPFWLGEAPSRTWELSAEVSRLRADVVAAVDREPDTAAVHEWLSAECVLGPIGAAQLTDYVVAQRDALGVVPTMDDVVFERFFDEAGGMQLVVHAPFGGRVNRAFGLALRKRFCVSFDFELQAAATDDAIVLSMGTAHSFPLTDAFAFVRSDQLDATLQQAVLQAPMFGTRWRWNASRALAVLRFDRGKKVPPFLQRMRADDLLAAVFPAQVACQDNAPGGPIEVPDQPIVRQTVRDCLSEAMDVERLRDVLQRIERGEIRLHARDTTEPSPFSHEVLNAKPYAFLDDAPLEERRARALSLRRTLPEHQRDLGALDEAAIARVVEEARPQPRERRRAARRAHGPRRRTHRGGVAAHVRRAGEGGTGGAPRRAGLRARERPRGRGHLRGRPPAHPSPPRRRGRPSPRRRRARPRARARRGERSVHVRRARDEAGTRGVGDGPSRSRGSRATVWSCAGASPRDGPRTRTARRSATVGCSRASTATPSTACAARSSRSAPGISSATSSNATG